MSEENKIITVKIPDGLKYHENVIIKDCESELIKWVFRSDAPWETATGNRLVQQYGYSYNYTTKSIERITGKDGFSFGIFPNVLDILTNSFLERKLLSVKPNQCIVNYYKPGQGISPHTDNIYYFDDEVSSLSLWSGITMDFSKGERDKLSLYLNTCSLLVLKEQARWNWKHGIKSKKNDNVNGIKVSRGERISLTFRTIKNK